MRSESGRSDPRPTTPAPTWPTSRAPRARTSATRSRPPAAPFGGWAKRTAYNRGQVLYRFAEALESRSDELARAAVAQQDAALPAARAELGAAVDLLVHYAGWTDKLAAVMGGINPVAAPYLSFSHARADRRRRRAGPGRAGRAGADPRGRARAGRRQHRRGARLAALAAARAGPRRGRGRLRRPRRRPEPAVRAHGRAARRRCAATATSTRSSTRPASASLAATIDELAAETVKRVTRPAPDGDTLARLEALMELKTAWHPVGT